MQKGLFRAHLTSNYHLSYRINNILTVWMESWNSIGVINNVSLTYNLSKVSRIVRTKAN